MLLMMAASIGQIDCLQVLGTNRTVPFTTDYSRRRLEHVLRADGFGAWDHTSVTLGPLLRAGSARP